MPYASRYTRVLSDHLCECGCNEYTYISQVTHRSDGRVRGQPRRFLPGHHLRLVPRNHSGIERFNRRQSALRARKVAHPRWERIIEDTARRFRVSVEELRSRDRTERIRTVRAKAYVALADAGASHTHIAQLFGRNKATITRVIATHRACR